MGGAIVPTPGTAAPPAGGQPGQAPGGRSAWAAAAATAATCPRALELWGIDPAATRQDVLKALGEFGEVRRLEIGGERAQGGPALAEAQAPEPAGGAAGQARRNGGGSGVGEAPGNGGGSGVGEAPGNGEVSGAPPSGSAPPLPRGAVRAVFWDLRAARLASHAAPSAPSGPLRGSTVRAAPPCDRREGLLALSGPGLSAGRAAAALEPFGELARVVEAPDEVGGAFEGGGRGAGPVEGGRRRFLVELCDVRAASAALEAARAGRLAPYELATPAFDRVRTGRAEGAGGSPPGLASGGGGRGANGGAPGDPSAPATGSPASAGAGGNAERAEEAGKGGEAISPTLLSASVSPPASTRLSASAAAPVSVSAPASSSAPGALTTPLSAPAPASLPPAPPSSSSAALHPLLQPSSQPGRLSAADLIALGAGPFDGPTAFAPSAAPAALARGPSGRASVDSLDAALRGGSAVGPLLPSLPSLLGAGTAGAGGELGGAFAGGAAPEAAASSAPAAPSVAAHPHALPPAHFPPPSTSLGASPAPGSPASPLPGALPQAGSGSGLPPSARPPRPASAADLAWQHASAGGLGSGSGLGGSGGGVGSAGGLGGSGGGVGRAVGAGGLAQGVPSAAAAPGSLMSAGLLPGVDAPLAFPSAMPSIGSAADLLGLADDAPPPPPSAPVPGRGPSPGLEASGNPSGALGGLSPRSRGSSLAPGGPLLGSGSGSGQSQGRGAELSRLGGAQGPAAPRGGPPPPGGPSGFRLPRQPQQLLPQQQPHQLLGSAADLAALLSDLPPHGRPTLRGAASTGSFWGLGAGDDLWGPLDGAAKGAGDGADAAAADASSPLGGQPFGLPPAPAVGSPRGQPLPPPPPCSSPAPVGAPVPPALARTRLGRNFSDATLLNQLAQAPGPGGALPPAPGPGYAPGASPPPPGAEASASSGVFPAPGGALLRRHLMGSMTTASVAADLHAMAGGSSLLDLHAFGNGGGAGQTGMGATGMGMGMGPMGAGASAFPGLGLGLGLGTGLGAGLGLGTGLGAGLGAGLGGSAADLAALGGSGGGLPEGADRGAQGFSAAPLEGGPSILHRGPSSAPAEGKEAGAIAGPGGTPLAPGVPGAPPPHEPHASLLPSGEPALVPAGLPPSRRGLRSGSAASDLHLLGAASVASDLHLLGGGSVPSDLHTLGDPQAAQQQLQQLQRLQQLQAQGSGGAPPPLGGSGAVLGTAIAELRLRSSRAAAAADILQQAAARAALVESGAIGLDGAFAGGEGRSAPSTPSHASRSQASRSHSHSHASLTQLQQQQQQQQQQQPPSSALLEGPDSAPPAVAGVTSPPLPRSASSATLLVHSPRQSATSPRLTSQRLAQQQLAQQQMLQQQLLQLQLQQQQLVKEQQQQQAQQQQQQQLQALAGGGPAGSFGAAAPLASSSSQPSSLHSSLQRGTAQTPSCEALPESLLGTPRGGSVTQLARAGSATSSVLSRAGQSEAALDATALGAFMASGAAFSPNVAAALLQASGGGGGGAGGGAGGGLGSPGPAGALGSASAADLASLTSALGSLQDAAGFSSLASLASQLGALGGLAQAPTQGPAAPQATSLRHSASAASLARARASTLGLLAGNPLEPDESAVTVYGYPADGGVPLGGLVGEDGQAPGPGGAQAGRLDAFGGSLADANAYASLGDHAGQQQHHQQQQHGAPSHAPQQSPYAQAPPSASLRRTQSRAALRAQSPRPPGRARSHQALRSLVRADESSDEAGPRGKGGRNAQGGARRAAGGAAAAQPASAAASTPAPRAWGPRAASHPAPEASAPGPRGGAGSTPSASSGPWADAAPGTAPMPHHGSPGQLEGLPPSLSSTPLGASLGGFAAGAFSGGLSSRLAAQALARAPPGEEAAASAQLAAALSSLDASASARLLRASASVGAALESLGDGLYGAGAGLASAPASHGVLHGARFAGQAVGGSSAAALAGSRSQLSLHGGGAGGVGGGAGALHGSAANLAALGAQGGPGAGAAAGALGGAGGPLGASASSSALGAGAPANASPAPHGAALGGRLARRPLDPAAEAERRMQQRRLYALDLDRVRTGEDRRTTLMIKNIPNKYTQRMLLSLIEDKFRGCFDFFYLPIDFKNKCNVGYAFVNVTDPRHILGFVREFHGKRWPRFNSEKVCAIAYGRIQGKTALVAHFQNSSLLHEDKRCRPVLFRSEGSSAGEPEVFPSADVGGKVRAEDEGNKL